MSEAALGEIEPTAENFLAHTGTGLLWGGAAGGALGSAGPLIGKTLGTGKAFAQKSGKSIKRMYERFRGIKAADGLEDALEKPIIKPMDPSTADRIYGAVYDFDPKKMAALKDPKQLARARKGAELREAGTKELGAYMDEMTQLHDDIAEKGIGVEKYKGIREVQAQADQVAAVSDSLGQLEAANARLMGMLEAGPAEFANPGAIKAAKEAILSADDALKTFARTTPDDAVAKSFIKLDQTKRTLQKRLKRLFRKIDKDDPQWSTIEELINIETGIRESLENPRLWGAGAAARQVKSNRAWVRKLKKKHMERRFSDVYEEVEYQKVFRTNRRTLKKTIDSVGLEESKFEQEFLDNFVDDQLEPARAIAESFELGPEYIKKLNRMNELGQKYNKAWARIKETVSLENQLADIMQKSSAMGSLVPGLGMAGVGYMVGGEEGAALGLALSPFTNPGRKLQLQAAINRISTDMNTKIGMAIKGYMKKVSGKVKPVAEKAKRIVGPTAQKVLQDSNWGDRRTKDKSRFDAFEKRSKELTEFVNNPQMAADRVTKNTEAISDAAPNVAAIAQLKAINAAAFLHRKMPKSKSSVALVAQKFKPSEVDLVRWERYVEAVLDPTVLLRDLAKGVLTRETKEAVETVYPRMYERIVIAIAEQIPVLREKIPYKEQNNLATLFGIPVSATMEPRFYQTQMVLGQMLAMPQEPQPRGPSAAGKVWGKMKAGQVALTETQRVQAESA
jgi:hypothetical protein